MQSLLRRKFHPQVLICALLLGFPTVASSQTFLTLPFPRGGNSIADDTEMNLQQGWYYTTGGLHSGIDYIQGAIDNSNTWQHFPIVAAADGEACGDGPAAEGPCAYFKDGGYRILIKHNVNNQTFYTYYGHMNWIAPWIPMGDRNKTVHVAAGSQIATAGSTGVVGTELHSLRGYICISVLPMVRLAEVNFVGLTHTILIAPARITPTLTAQMANVPVQTIVGPPTHLSMPLD